MNTSEVLETIRKGGLKLLAYTIAILIAAWFVFDEVKYESVKVQNEALKSQNEKLKSDLEGSISKSDIKKTVTKIAEETIKKFNESNFNKSDRHPFEIKTETEISGDYIDTHFYLEQKVYFPIYEYNIKEAYRKSGLISAISTFLRSVQEFCGNRNLIIFARFEGGG